jgi:hypothetical protein
MTSRRRAVRRPRRVHVHFWKRGEPHTYPGYTTNISTTGMFLATNSPLPPGTRLRVEILAGDRGFMVEGVVAHARKTRNDLMRLTQPGMGIRFLAVEELVRELIPAITGDTEEIPEAPSAPPPAGAAPSPPAPERPAPAPAPRPAEGGGAFNMGFASPSEFLEIYQRDILNGGLFVSTRYPGRLQEIVRIELRPPLPGAAPIVLRARVVQRFEPQEGSFGPNLLAGMGVEILDLPAVLVELRPIVEKLKG